MIYDVMITWAIIKMLMINPNIIIKFYQKFSGFLALGGGGSILKKQFKLYIIFSYDIIF